jgi:hypothetical protein
MKTIATLLMTSFLLVGTFNTVTAREEDRSERSPRQRNEIQFKREITTERRNEYRRNGNDRSDRPRVENRHFDRRPDFEPRANISYRVQQHHCAICYNPLRNDRLDCSLEELAWLETNRIARALELSEYQRNRVFDINFRYITHHYHGEYYPTARRDREIRGILRLGQVVAFAILLNELRDGDLCYTCSNEHY